jgi:toxin ParE1/3/4
VAKYELSRAADRDLDDIYVYTFRQFGALQADVYFESLEECLTKLAENPLLGVDASAFLELRRRPESL